MSQSWPSIAATQSLASSLAPILQRDETVRASFAGTAFPTNPAPVIGQTCFRTDLQALYVCTAISPTTVWTLVYDRGAADARYARLNAANTFTVNPTVNGNALWHAGNDGSGSGLDADLLDGLNATAFSQLTANQTFTGVNTFQRPWDGTNATLTFRSGNAANSAYVAYGRVGNEWLEGMDAADSMFKWFRWNGSTWANLMQINTAGRLWTATHGWLDDAFFGKGVGSWHTDAGGTARFLFTGAGDGNTYYRSGSGHVMRNAGDQNIVTFHNNRWAYFAQGAEFYNYVNIAFSQPHLYFTHPSGQQWYLQNDNNWFQLVLSGTGVRFAAASNGWLWSGNYGWLHDFFFYYIDNANVTTGTGSFLSLPDIYLADYGGLLQLVRSRSRYDCNCDCNCNCGQCVVAGTQVQMADGSTKAVEDLAAGDVLVDGLGNEAVMVGMHRVPLGARRLFRVNGVGISEDHPLLGLHGWTAPDPIGVRAARFVRDDLGGTLAFSAYDAAYGPVDPLATGTWLQGTAGPVQAAVVEVEDADPAQTLYSPILRGAGSFVAGGLVHGALRLSHLED